MPTYARQTLDSVNPLARFAHQRRYAASQTFTAAAAGEGASLLDYGCGEGHFLQLLGAARPDLHLIGFDPYSVHAGDGYDKIHDTAGVPDGSIDVLTCFETLEHLEAAETDQFLVEAMRLLTAKGKLVISVPIIGGPPLLLKEANRVALYRRRSDYTARELLAAAAIGRPAPRPADIKTSHKGFDFHAVEPRMRRAGLSLHAAALSPFPALPWWLNSQSFAVFSR